MVYKKRQGRCFCSLEIQEFTLVNDLISRQKNEEIGDFLSHYLATRSSHLTINIIVNIEIAVATTKIPHVIQIGMLS